MFNAKGKMIRYFILSGDADVEQLFEPYLWSMKGLARRVKSTCEVGAYGSDLRLILIQYYVEGKYDIGAPPAPRLRHYSKKNKDIAVAFPVTHDRFHDVGEQERRQFIVDTTFQSIDMVEARLGKRRLDIDFVSLRRDVNSAAREYLAQADPCLE